MPPCCGYVQVWSVDLTRCGSWQEGEAEKPAEEAEEAKEEAKEEVNACAVAQVHTHRTGF